MTSDPVPDPAVSTDGGGVPRTLRWVVGLLVVNRALSVVVTVATFLARDSIAAFQLDHRHITSPAVRASLAENYRYSIASRAVGNVLASIV